MARFQANPWDLDDLLSMLDRRKVVLPEFQRSFVWRPMDIDLLLTSIVQDFPAGSLLLLGRTQSWIWRGGLSKAPRGRTTGAHRIT